MIHVSCATTQILKHSKPSCQIRIKYKIPQIAQRSVESSNHINRNLCSCVHEILTRNVTSIYRKLTTASASAIHSFTISNILFLPPADRSMPTICPPYLRLSVESATATAKVVSTLVQLQDCQDAGHEASRSLGRRCGLYQHGRCDGGSIVFHHTKVFANATNCLLLTSIRIVLNSKCPGPCPGQCSSTCNTSLTTASSLDRY